MRVRRFSEPSERLKLVEDFASYRITAPDNTSLIFDGDRMLLRVAQYGGDIIDHDIWITDNDWVGALLDNLQTAYAKTQRGAFTVSDTPLEPGAWQ